MISICIPAYKNLSHLERLLGSIAEQSFKNFEVIITDDTPDDSISQLVMKFKNKLPLTYHKNVPSLGTPGNWNKAIAISQGRWIKLMHNDDWFNSPEALERISNQIDRNPGCNFFFTAFQNVVEGTDKVYKVKCHFWDLFFLKLSELHLFKRVYVGNPSCTIVNREVNELYDERFKFVVDFEYYIRCFRKLKNYKYIDDILINVGFHQDQVTKHTFLVPAVQIPENLILLQKLGPGILRNPVVYDYYWRMIRNLGVRRIEEVHDHYSGTVPGLIASMINFQAKFSKGLLQKGVASKILMLTSYLTSLFKRH